MDGTVLLVDDAADYRRLIRMLLEDLAVDVIEAADGAEGIQKAGEFQPQMILLDLAMPVMDGFEALPKIREAAPDATVIVLSGYIQDSIEEEVRGLGAHAVLEKGLGIVDMLEFFEEHLIEARPF